MLVAFKLIKFVNYKSIKNGSLSLDGRGVLLIKGINNDKTGSNGAGKSAIANGLLWCLYDQTLTGKEAEVEILPKFIPKKEFKKEGCYVTVIVFREDVEYHITRYRKHPEFKNTVVLKKYINNRFKNLSKCVDKETNELIVSIIGADFNSFVHSNIFSFNNIEPFLNRSDKDKKELILPTFFVEKFKIAYKNTINEIKIIDTKILELNNKEITNTVQLSEKTSQLQDVERNIKEHEEQITNTKIQIQKEYSKQDDIESKMTGCEVAIRNFQFSIKNLLEKAEQTAKTVKEYELKKTEYGKLFDEKLVRESKLSVSYLKMEQLKNRSNDLLVTKLAELNASVIKNTNEYTHFNNQMDELNNILSRKTILLAEIRETEEKIKDKLDYQNKDFVSNQQNLVQTQSILDRLYTQKNNVLDKYFSKECQACIHNKINEVLSDIEKDIESYESNLTKFQNRDKIIKKVISELQLKVKEITVLEQTIMNELRVIKSGEFIKCQNNLLIVSTKLHDLKNVVIKVQSDIEGGERIIQEISTIQQNINKNSIRIKEIQKLMSDFEDPNKFQILWNEQSHLCQEIKIDINAQQMDERKVTDVLKQLEFEMKIIDEKIRSLSCCLSVPQDLVSLRTELNLALNSLRNEKIDIEKDRTAELHCLDILKFWKIGFSSIGVEGFMLDSIMNSMNTLIAKYIGYLSNNTISLTLIPDSTLKSGERRNKISEIVENESGGPTYKSSSSGERRIMDIAVLFALKYINEQITKTKYNVMFCDEIFDALDASTCSLVINLLHSMEDINSIFVVSHSDSIALEFDNSITIIKTKGISEINNESN